MSSSKRQMAYVKRKLERGLCASCQEQRVNATHCEFHRQDANRRSAAWRARQKETA